MTSLTDDELGTLLRETFADREHLADPDRAVALATSAPPASHRGRALLVAAAAVALVAVGTTYVVARPDGRHPVAEPTPPAPSGQPPLPALRTDAGNRLQAVAACERALAGVPSYPGSRTTRALPELSSLYTSVGPADHTVVSDRWSLAGAPVTARGVAQWYADHPARGYASDGGVGSASGSGTGVVYVVDFQPRGPHRSTAPDLVVQTTTTASGVGIRATAQTVWAPARPLASFVQDVSSIDVRSVHHQYGRRPHTTRRTWSFSDPRQVLHAAQVFNALPGEAPWTHSCPMIADTWTDRVIFHTTTGDVTATSVSGACGFGMSVHRAGRLVGPPLGDSARLLRALGLDH